MRRNGWRNKKNIRKVYKIWLVSSDKLKNRWTKENRHLLLTSLEATIKTTATMTDIYPNRIQEWAIIYKNDQKY